MTHRSTKPSPGAMDTHDSQPSMSSSLDILIGYNVGSSVMLEATLERLQASKKNPRPTLSQEIEQLTRENGYLRQELTYHHKMHEASIRLAWETQDVVERLRRAVFDYRNTQKEIDI